MITRTSRRVVAALSIAVVAVLAAGCSGGSAGRFTPRHHLPDTPVLLVHGYNAETCPGNDVTRAVWGSTYLDFTNVGWRGPVLPVSYYACDHDGVDVTGYGPTVPAGGAPVITGATPRVRYDQNTGIDVLAHDLAWFIYLSYTSTGKPVDLVAASMGGLIIRDLLYRVAQHDPRFPPKLAVTHVVTFSTPYAGFGGTGGSSICPVDTIECQQFAVGSPLITELNSDPKLPQGDGGTAWAAAGSSAGCDLVPASSSLAVTGAHRIDYSLPCYQHVGYLWDLSLTTNASAKITQPDGTATTTTSAPHSLAWMISMLTS